MKKHILVALTALAFTAAAFAQANKPAPDPVKPADTTKPAGKEEALSIRPMPMNSRVDEIDAEGKTFTQNTRDGRKVKHIITKKTQIKQGSDSAKFEDIKIGDMVAGSRIKKNAEGTEYEIIKITKFGSKTKAAEKK